MSIGECVLKHGEVLAILGVVALVSLLALWLWINYQRRKFKERPRLPIIDTPLNVSDWRLLVPPEYRTAETERLELMRWIK